MIFNKRWYGIKGETIEKGSKYAMSVVRVQTTKDGPWQALTDKELEQLLAEHNFLVYEAEKNPRPRAKPLIVTIPDPDKPDKAPSIVKMIKKKMKPRFNIKEQVKVLGADSLLPPSKKKAKKSVAKKKGKKK